MTQADYFRDGRFYCRKFTTREKALAWLDSKGIRDYVLSPAGKSVL